MNNEELTTFAYDLSNVAVDYIMYDNSLDDGEFEIWDSKLTKKTPLEKSLFEIILAKKDDRSKRGKVIIYPLFFESAFCPYTFAPSTKNILCNK